MNEDLVIKKLSKLFTTEAGSASEIGDDCAFLEEKDLLVTTDSLIESVHFLPGTCLKSLGWKLLAISFSDIAAMGGTPSHSTLNFHLPKNFSENSLDELLNGINECSKKYNCKIIGGDTVRSDKLELVATVLGSPINKPALRTTAKPGEDIWVGGPLGYAALGALLEGIELGELKLEKDFDEDRARQAFLRPIPQLELAEHLAKENLATSMMDLSDGLIADSEKLAESSKVSLAINPELIPQVEASSSTLPHALFGGEDYKLLFTAQKKHRDLLANIATRIGSVNESTNSKVFLSIQEKFLPLEEAKEALGLSQFKPFSHHF